MRGGAIYVASVRDLRIFDIRDPRRPERVGAYFTPQDSGGQGAFALADGTALMAGGSSGLRLLDLSDPRNPFELSALMPPANMASIAVGARQQHMFRLDQMFDFGSQIGLQLVAFDSVDPIHPREVSSFQTPAIHGHEVPGGALVIDGNDLYVADPLTGLYILRSFEGPHVYLPLVFR